MGRKSRRGGQYLSNVGYSNGYTTPNTSGYLRGTDVGLANPTPFGATRTMSGGMFEWLTNIFKKTEPAATGDPRPDLTNSVPVVTAPAPGAPAPDAPDAPAPDASGFGGGFRRSRRGGFRRRSRRSRRSKRSRRR